MNTQRRITAETGRAAPVASLSLRTGTLQRKCACGGEAGPNGECLQCRRKRQLGGALQAKLRVGRPDTPLEREADRMADTVMRLPASGLRPPVGKGKQETPAAILLGRHWSSGGNGSGDAPAVLHEVLRSPGRPMDSRTTAFMESRFGHDFGAVRIHSDGTAAESAQVLGARAFTVGQDIVFGADQYAPGTESGRRLLAHELSHTIQQRSIPVGQVPTVMRRIIPGPPRLPVELIPGMETWECFDGVINDMYSYTRRYARRYCERTGNPIPNNRYDAFGHCWIACAASRRCGRTATAILGTAREIWRELDQDPHDSYSQDTGNQSHGRRLSTEEGTCFELCESAARADELDLTAQPLHCLDCSTLQPTRDCGTDVELVPPGHPERRRGTGWLPPL